MIVSLLLLIVLSAVSLSVGAADISLLQPDAHSWQILTESRIPRLVSILITGAGMATAGLVMQQLSQNKFASPSTSGTIESAGFGILLTMVWLPDASVAVKIAVAFACAIVGTRIFIYMLHRVVYKDALFIPLLGIMFGRVVAALTTFIAYKYDLIQSLNARLYGDFSGILKGRYELLYLGIVVIVLTYLYAHKFTIAGFGESFAKSLGVDYAYVRQLGLVLIAVTTAIVVLTVGEVPFIGLIIPNLVTMVRGDNVRANLPYVATGGALFVLLCDIIGRLLIFPYEISVSLIIGIVGGTAFLAVLTRRHLYG